MTDHRKDSLVGAAPQVSSAAKVTLSVWEQYKGSQHLMRANVVSALLAMHHKFISPTALSRVRGQRRRRCKRGPSQHRHLANNYNVIQTGASSLLLPLSHVLSISRSLSFAFYDSRRTTCVGSPPFQCSQHERRRYHWCHTLSLE